MAKNVTTIPATRNRFTADPISSRKKRRVAGYARVSTDMEDQQTSYAAQCDYYTNYMPDAVDSFDESAWYALVDYATVYGRDDVRFTFKNGMEIKA